MLPGSKDTAHQRGLVTNMHCKDTHLDNRDPKRSHTGPSDRLQNSSRAATAGAHLTVRRLLLVLDRMHSTPTKVLQTSYLLCLQHLLEDDKHC